MYIYYFVLLLLASSFISSTAAGEVETITYCDTLPIKSVDWADNHTLQLFDPSLGDLVRVDLAVDLFVLQDFNVENKDESSQTLSVDSDVGLIIVTPDSSSISVTASGSIGEELAGFDGVVDFSGPSGRTIKGFASDGKTVQQYLKLSDFIASTPGETVLLPVFTSITSETQIPGCCVFSMSTVAGSKLCVTYTYELESLGDGGAAQ